MEASMLARLPWLCEHSVNLLKVCQLLLALCCVFLLTLILPCVYLSCLSFIDLHYLKNATYTGGEKAPQLARAVTDTAEGQPPSLLHPQQFEHKKRASSGALPAQGQAGFGDTLNDNSSPRPSSG